jgi:hypothetical protein
VRPATALAPSFSAREADVAAQLAPVRRIERSQFAAMAALISPPTPGMVLSFAGRLLRQCRH